ncbi:MAG: hypothetical protein ACREFP_11480 [Acetobacteraceae bacterium]
MSTPFRQIESARRQPVGDADLYVMINAYWQNLTFAIQAPGPWQRIADTALATPSDILEASAAPLRADPRYDVAGRSIVVLLADQGRGCT